MNFNPVEAARRQAEQRQGSGNPSNFLTIKDGESVTVRLLTGFNDCNVVNHACGLSFDYPIDKWEAAKAAGSLVCPNCGQPLTDADIAYVRPVMPGANMHRYMPTSDPSKRASFVCLADQDNAAMGLTPSNNGAPVYPCPVCSCSANINKQTGKPRLPQMRLYATAVVRKLEIENQMVNGIMKPVVKGISDEMVKDDDTGEMRPKIVVVENGWKNFFGLMSNQIANAPTDMVCYFDWTITRIGEKLETRYDIQAVQGTEGYVDYRSYQDYLPNIESLLKHQGSPDWYVEKGYGVQGYVKQEQPQAQAQPAQQAQQMMNQVAQPGFQQQQSQQFQPQPGFQPQPAPMGAPMGDPMAQAAQIASQMPPQVAQSGQDNNWSTVQNQLN